MRIKDMFYYPFPLRILAITFVSGAMLGYCSHDNIATDKRFRIERRKSQPFLVDRFTNESQPITSELQLGTVEYRIEGLLLEEKLDARLSELSEKYKAK
jgi:hypothetical protein